MAESTALGESITMAEFIALGESPYRKQALDGWIQGG
jgi:hypothetical protein